MEKPIIQYALDVTTIDSALALAHQAVDAGIDWLEVGGPLIKFEGVHAIEALHQAFPNQYIIVDFMILSGSERYIKAAKEKGANNVTITALAPDETVQEAINLCKKYDIHSTVDLFNKEDVVYQAKKYEEMGADYIMVHYGVDQKKFNPDGSPISNLKKVVEEVNIPVSYATYDYVESREAVGAGANVIVQGEPLLSTSNPKEALEQFIQKTLATTKEMKE